MNAHPDTRTLLLYFDDEQAPAHRLAEALGIPARAVARHRFPDDEIKLRLPVDAGAPAPLPERIVLYRSLARPNEKLVELMLVCGEVRELGVRRIVLVAPYLAYMRQDMAFEPGDVVSQRVVGRFLATLVDAVLTVDPHLHRISHLKQAIPLDHALSLCAAPVLAEVIARHHTQPVLIGPDAESAQWVAAAAAARGWAHGVCTKQRHGDKQVNITLPDIDVVGRSVVLLDDVASSGHTLAQAAQGLREAGAAQIDVAVTHALFADDALAVIHAAGVRHVWSTDCIAHESNAAPMAPLLAEAVRGILATP